MGPYEIATQQAGRLNARRERDLLPLINTGDGIMTLSTDLLQRIKNTGPHSVIPDFAR